MADALTSRLQSVADRCTRSAVLSIGAVVAALFLTRLLLLPRFPPFFDESLYASWALQVHQSFGARWLPLLNGKLPLLSWLGAAFMMTGAGPLTAVRLVSIAAGVVSAVFVALIGKEIGGRATSIAAASVYVILPLALVHDAMGLMEPLLAALFAAAFFLQLRLARRPSLVTGGLLGIVFAAGLLTKETSYLPLVLLPMSLVLFDWRDAQRIRRLGTWVGAAAAACLLGEGAELLLDSSGKMSVYRAAQQSFGTFRSLGSGLSHPLRFAVHEWPGYQPMVIGYLTWPLTLAALAGVVVGLWRRDRRILLCVLWLLSLFAVDILFLTDAFARYLVPATPFFAVLVGVGLVEVVRLVGRVAPNVTAAVLASALVCAGLAAVAVRFDVSVLENPNTAAYPGVSIQEYETGWSAGTGVAQLAATLRTLTRASLEVIGFYGQPPIALRLELRDDPSASFVDSNASSTASVDSNYVITNDLPLPAGGLGLGTLRPLQTFPRPHNGVAQVLYERGVYWGRRFYTTPDELRRASRSDERQFRRFIAQHARVRAWYLASPA